MASVELTTSLLVPMEKLKSFHLTRKVSRISNPKILAGWKAPLNIMLAWLRRMCLRPREQAYLYGGLLCFFLACACKAGVDVVIQTHYRILSYPKTKENKCEPQNTHGRNELKYKNGFAHNTHKHNLTYGYHTHVKFL